MSEYNSKPLKFKVQAGMVCTFDYENKIKQRDSEITHVLVHERVKHRFFGKSGWLVQNADDPKAETFTCPEWLLKPINVSALRFPTNIPEFNDIDIDCLKYFIKILDDEERIRNLCSSTNKNLSGLSIETAQKKIKRLQAIYEKVKFSKELRDI